MGVSQQQLLQQQQAFVRVQTNESASQNTHPDEIQPATPPTVSPSTSSPYGICRSTAVKVAVRIRPRCKHERKRNSEHEQHAVWPQGPSTLQVFSGPGQPPKSLQFDAVLGPHASQEEVFEAVGKPLVAAVLRGCHGTCLTFGQPGAGKSYTMLGSETDGKMLNAGRSRSGQSENVEDSQGLMPRMLSHLFQAIAAREAGAHIQHTCRCSYLQIYNEQVLDLLDPDNGEQHSLTHNNQGVHAEGLHEEVVLNAKEAIAVLRSGAANRKVVTTSTNTCSNRSHCIMRVTVECTEERDSQLSKVFTAQLTLVDLGSSETDASSANSREGQPTSAQPQPDGCKRSLEALTNVIYKMAQGRQHEAPYRDSKLTYFLQSAFGGNAEAAVVANVAPTFSALQHTLSTLKVAQNAAQVKNLVQPSTFSKGEKQALQAEIKRLRSQVASMKGQEQMEMELAQAKKETQMVAETLRTTLERLEEEISRNNELQGALKNANQRLSTRERTIASMQQQLASAMRQQPLNSAPSTPSRATHGNLHRIPSLNRASSITSTQSTVTSELHSQMHAYSPHDPALSKRSKSLQSASGKAHSQGRGSHSVAHDPAANSHAQGRSQASHSLLRHASPRSVESAGNNGHQRSDSYSARGLEDATAEAAAQIATLVATAERALQGSDLEPCGDTADFLAKLPPHAIPDSPTDTMAAHAQAVALASASVLSGGPRPSVSMPTDEAAAAAAKAADDAAHRVGTMQARPVSGGGKETLPQKAERPKSDSQAQNRGASASPAKSSRSATQEQHIPQPDSQPYGPQLQMHERRHMQQQQHELQHHARQYHHPVQQPQQAQPTFPPPAVQPPQDPPPGRTVQPTVPHGYSLGELAPLPFVGQVSDSSFSDMTDFPALPKAKTRANKPVPPPPSSGKHTPSPLASVHESDVERLSVPPGRMKGGSAAVQHISLQASETARMVSIKDSAARTPQAGAPENRRSACSNGKVKEKATPSGSNTVDTPALDKSQDTGSNVENQNHLMTAEKAQNQASAAGARKHDASAAPAVPASPPSSTPADNLHKKISEEQARGTPSPEDASTPRQWSPGSQSSAGGEHSRNHHKAPLQPGQLDNDNGRPAATPSSRRRGDRSPPAHQGRSETEGSILTESDPVYVNGKSLATPIKGDDPAVWKVKANDLDTERAHQPAVQVHSNDHVAAKADLEADHLRRPTTAAQLNGKTNTDLPTPHNTAVQPEAANVLEPHSRSQTLDREVGEHLDSDSECSSSEEEEDEELKQKIPAPHRLESLGDESLHMEISCMGGFSFAGNAVDHSGALDGASDTGISGKTADSKQLDIQTKARTVEEHFNILGEVGNQAAERAMQRRQQLLAEQEQWLSGEQIFKGMNTFGMMLDEADMYSTTTNLLDVPNHEKDLYTLQEECTADFSDISRVFSEHWSRGDPGTPRQLKVSLSRGMMARSPFGDLASPNVQSKAASDSIDFSKEVELATSSPAPHHDARDAFPSAPRSPSAMQGAMHPLQVIQELGPSRAAAESTAEPDPQAHAVMHPVPVATSASAPPEPKTPRGKPVNGINSDLQSPRKLEEGRSAPSSPEPPLASKKASDERRNLPASDAAEPPQRSDTTRMNTFDFWKEDDHDLAGGAAAVRDGSSEKPARTTVPKPADSIVAGAASQPTVATHRNAIRNFFTPLQNLRDGSTRSPDNKTVTRAVTHHEEERRSPCSPGEKERKNHDSDEKQSHLAVNVHAAAAGNVSISPYGSPQKTTPPRVSMLPKTPVATPESVESQSANEVPRSPQSPALNKLDSRSDKGFSLSSLRTKGAQIDGFESLPAQLQKPPVNKRGSWGLGAIKTPKGSNSSETPRRRAASDKIAFDEDDLSEEKPRSTLQRSLSVYSSRSSLPGAESPRVSGSFGASPSKAAQGDKPKAIMSARARRAMTTEKLFLR